MPCKICSTPGPGMCSRCEAEVKVNVLEATNRIGTRLAGTSQAVTGAVLLQKERSPHETNRKGHMLQELQKPKVYGALTTRM